MNLDEELIQDAEEDAQAIEYIKTHIPQELQEKFSDDILYYFLDVVIEYYAESGILDKPADKDGYIDIDEQAIANYLANKAKKENIGDFSADDLLFVVQAQLDFEEELDNK